MKSSIMRLALWACAGLFVSAGWGLYFATANKAVTIDSIVYALAELSQPAAAIIIHIKPSLPLGLTWVAVANGVTYALFGLITQTFRRHN